MNGKLKDALVRNRQAFHKVVEFDETRESLLQFNFTESNKEITAALVADTNSFSTWINKKLADAGATFGIGGYNENRTLYKRSTLFSGTAERTLHLGTDIWGPAGTAVFAPLGGMVHGFAFNNNFGDYGATIILQHQADTATFYTLYGHLSLADLASIRKGKFLTRGEVVGHFGKPEENGNWPPHLHFQIIEDIGFNEGDYPGVCSLQDAEKYLYNCPDPDFILQVNKNILMHSSHSKVGSAGSKTNEH